ncbi:MAG: hypothetical protein M0Z85_05725 [Gammaproteobacteria bacterium]|nr:hypothetical protein [Gammaproteobacteria bacterium]
MRTVIGIRPANLGHRAVDDANGPHAHRLVQLLARTLRHLERHGLVKMHRSPDTRAMRPEALATEFLIVLD